MKNKIRASDQSMEVAQTIVQDPGMEILQKMLESIQNLDKNMKKALEQ